MSMNPPPPEPTRKQKIQTAVRREASKRAELIVYILGITTGVIVSRL